MWFFTKYGFFSVVCASKPVQETKHGIWKEPDLKMLMVRARLRSHLTALVKRFPQLERYTVRTSHNTDYAFRMLVPKMVWETVAQNLVNELDYSNFKLEAFKTVGSHDRYVTALHDVWADMERIQPWPAYGRATVPAVKEVQRGIVFETFDDDLDFSLDEPSDKGMIRGSRPKGSSKKSKKRGRKG